MVQLLPPLKIQKKKKKKTKTKNNKTKKKSASKVSNHKVKIYPQTAPEIPTGESSIGWEAGGAGWATVPPHHPPRGSCTVTANSPGSPGLRKQGPGKGGGCHRGWSGHQHKAPRALAWPVLARLSLGRRPGVQRQAERKKAQAHWECVPALLWSLPVTAASSEAHP